MNPKSYESDHSLKLFSQGKDNKLVLKFSSRENYAGEDDIDDKKGQEIVGSAYDQAML